MSSEKAHYQAIGKKIKEAREGVGLSQRDLANELGYSSTTAISLIEAGERKVAVSDLQRIADILKRDIKYFLGEREVKADLSYALRSDPNLNEDDKKAIELFIDFAKNRKKK